MNSLDNLINAPRTNGHVAEGKAPRKASKAPHNSTDKANRAAAKQSRQLAKRIALGVGSVGIGVLGLSVTHCTESISLLTGSPLPLAGLLAVGIDAGMVGCELAALASRCELAALASQGTKKAERSVVPWANGYVVVAVLLSVLLNSYAFGLHAAEGMLWASWLLGAAVPLLVYALGRVSGHLWLGE